MNARFYLQDIGRFASADTLMPNPGNPQSFNRFSYGYNNPVKYFDPEGHAPTDGCDYEGCTLPEFMDPNNTWIDEEGSYYLYPPHLSSTEQLDAFAGGLSASGSLGSPFVSVEGIIGFETVVNPHTDQITAFFIIGGDISLGLDTTFVDWMKQLLTEDDARPGVGFSMYGAAIHNVDDAVTDYSGPFISETTSAGYVIGGFAGEAYSPNDPDRQRAYSEVAGLTVGATGLTYNVGSSYYFPIATFDVRTWGISSHFSEAIDVLSGIFN